MYDEGFCSSGPDYNMFFCEDEVRSMMRRISHIWETYSARDVCESCSQIEAPFHSQHKSIKHTPKETPPHAIHLPHVLTHPPLTNQPHHILKSIQDALHPHTPHILAPQHIRSQIGPLDPHERTPPAQPLPQGLGPDNKQIAQFRKNLHARLEGVVERPGAQEFGVLGQVLGDHEAAGGVDLEFLEVVEEEGAEAEGEFGQEGEEVEAVEGLGGEVVGAGEEGVD